MDVGANIPARCVSEGLIPGSGASLTPRAMNAGPSLTQRAMIAGPSLTQRALIAGLLPQELHLLYDVDAQ